MTKPKQTTTKHGITSATICVPTYNGEEYLRQLLTMATRQKDTVPYDILVVDSGSKDSSVEIVQSFKSVKLHTIPNSEFGHGKTRNLGAQMATGDIVVFLSQDAVPANEHWLKGMIEPFYLRDDLVCVVGKQQARPHCDTPTKREVNGVFRSLGPDHSLMLHRGRWLDTNQTYPKPLTFFSDVNSAVRRDFLLNTNPYQDVRYAEDQLLGKDVLDNGYLKAYAPDGLVLHSNEYNLSDYFSRKFDEHKALFETLGVLPAAGYKHHIKTVIRESAKDVWHALRDAEYTPKQKLYNICTAPIRNVQRERSARIIANPILRERAGIKHSLEHKNKLKSS